jgi:hypothetical protein
MTHLRSKLEGGFDLILFVVLEEEKHVHGVETSNIYFHKEFRSLVLVSLSHLTESAREVLCRKVV